MPDCGHSIYAEDIRRSILSMSRKLKEEAVPVELISGVDIRLTYELVDGIDRGDILTINGTRYFLVELPDLIPQKQYTSERIS